GVVKAGDALIEIVPAGETLLVEVRIKSNDIAFVRLEQDAIAKISAYDYSIFGGLECKVSEISKDASGERDAYHRLRVRCAKAFLGRDGEILPITLGMIGQVDIRTGRRTLLDRLLDQLNRLLGDSLVVR